MSSVDKRVVEMQFKNKDFLNNADATMNKLDKLKAALRFTSGEDGFNKISKAANKVDLSGIQNGVEAISNRFSTLGIVGMRVLQNLTDSAMNFGKKLYSNTIGQIMQGGKTRALNIEQAKFQLEGLIGQLDENWNGFKEDILYAVEGTAYGLDESAKVASQLAASGYTAGKDMKQYLRGISGVAAMTNATYSDIGHIFTRVAANDRVYADDLLSISSRGLNASAAIAKQMGVTEKEVKQLVSDGKVDFDTFAKAMDNAFGAHAKEANKTYEGSLSNVRAALSRLGAKVYEVKIENLKNVFNALIPVIDKVSSLLDPVLNKLNGFQTLMSNKVVKVLNAFSDKNDVGILNDNAGALEGTLKAAKDGTKLKDVQAIFDEVLKSGHMTEETVKSLNKIGLDIMWPLQAYFENVKGITLSQSDLIKMIREGKISYEQFTKVLSYNYGILAKHGKLMLDIQTSLHRIKGLFIMIKGQFHGFTDAIKPDLEDFRDGLLSIGKLFGGVIVKLAPTLIPIAKIIRTLLQLGASILGVIGRATTAIVELLANSKLLNGFLSLTVKLLGGFAEGFKYFAGGFASFISKIGKSVDSFKKLHDSIHPVSYALDGLTKLFDYLTDKAVAAKNVVASVFGKIAEALSSMNKALSETINSGSLDAVLKALATGGLAWFVKNLVDIDARLINIKGRIKDISTYTGRMKIANIFGGDLIPILERTEAVMVAYQRDLNAKALKGIGEAMLMMAGALLILSSIDPKHLAVGLTGLAGAMLILTVGLQGMMKVLGGMGSLGSGFKGTIKNMINFFMMSAMIKQLSESMLILSVALKILSTMDVKGAITGLVSIQILMNMFTRFAETFPRGEELAGIGTAVLAMMGFAVALGLMAIPLKILGSMDFMEMVQGLVTMNIVLKSLLKFSTEFAKLKFNDGAARQLVIMAVAMNGMAIALKILSTIPFKKLMVSLTAFLGILASVYAFMNGLSNIEGLDGKEFAKISAGMILIGGSLILMATAIKILSGIDLPGLVMAMVSLAMSLGLIVDVMRMMPKDAAAKAGGMLLMAAAIGVIALAVRTLGSLSIGDLIKGLAGVVVILGSLTLAMKYMQGEIAGAAAMFIVSMALATLADSVAKLGKLSLGQIAKGLFALVAAMAVMAAGSVAFSAVLPFVLGFSAALLALGAAVALFGLAVGAFGVGLAALAGSVGVLGKVVETVILIVPKIAKAAALLVVNFVKEMADSFGPMAESMVKMLRQLLDVLAENIGPIMDNIVKIIITYLTKLNENIGPIIDNVAKLIVTCLTKLAENLQPIMDAGGDVVVAFIEGIGENLPKIVDAGFDLIITFINSLADAIEERTPELLVALTNLALALPKALLVAIPLVAQKGREFIQAFGQAISRFASNAWQAAKSAGKRAVDGIKDTISKWKAAGKDAILGFGKGITDWAGNVIDSVKKFGKNALKALKNVLGIKSPSREFAEIAMYSLMGFAKGVEDNTSTVTGAVRVLGNKTLDTMSSLTTALANAIDDDVNPTITPVIDMSQVRTGIGAINSMFGSKTIGVNGSGTLANSVSARIQNGSSSATQTAQQITNYNFTQTNNSPKALSRLEIYRQTQNQLAAAKGLI